MRPYFVAKSMAKMDALRVVVVDAGRRQHNILPLKRLLTQRDFLSITSIRVDFVHSLLINLGCRQMITRTILDILMNIGIL